MSEFLSPKLMPDFEIPIAATQAEQAVERHQATGDSPPSCALDLFDHSPIPTWSTIPHALVYALVSVLSDRIHRLVHHQSNLDNTRNGI